MLSQFHASVAHVSRLVFPSEDRLESFTVWIKGPHLPLKTLRPDSGANSTFYLSWRALYSCS